MFPLEASISVALAVEGGRVSRVTIDSSRRPDASRLLAGREPAAAVALLPNVFSLCGTSQALAAATAVESAQGLGSVHAPARAAMLAAETVAEHLLGMARDWAEALGEAPDLTVAKFLKPTVAAIRKALYPDNDWHRPGGGRLAPDESVLAAGWATLRQAADILLPGVAARLLARVEAEGDFGSSDTPPLPEDAAPRLADRLMADDGFAARPDLDGTHCETGPLARHPQSGNGVAARLRARVAEVEHLLQTRAAVLLSSGPGSGAVPSPRGVLLHAVRLEDGKLADLRILAPTEWNFHPDGPLARGLLGVAAGDGLEWRARLLSLALDPCVACRIRVE